MEGFGREFITAFVKSTEETFKIQVGIEVKPQKSFILKEGEGLKSDISGVIGVVSEDFTGSLSLLFKKDIFLAIASKLLMEDFTEINELNESAAGELANIILGQAKRKLNEEHDYTIQLALPSIITGDGHEVHEIHVRGEGFVVPFECEHGTFYVKLRVSKKDNGDK